VTAGWIDLDLRLPVPLPSEEESREGRAWNDRVHPEVDAAEGLRIASDTAETHRTAGFALALASPDAGVVAGTAALVRLTGRDDRRTTVESGLAMVTFVNHDDGARHWVVAKPYSIGYVQYADIALYLPTGTAAADAEAMVAKIEPLVGDAQFRD